MSPHSAVILKDEEIWLAVVHKEKKIWILMVRKIFEACFHLDLLLNLYSKSLEIILRRKNGQKNVNSFSIVELK